MLKLKSTPLSDFTLKSIYIYIYVFSHSDRNRLAKNVESSNYDCEVS